MEVVKLLAPVILIIFGIVIKVSKSEQFSPMKKYWLFFLIIGVFLFAFKLYKYIN